MHKNNSSCFSRSHHMKFCYSECPLYWTKQQQQKKYFVYPLETLSRESPQNSYNVVGGTDACSDLRKLLGRASDSLFRHQVLSLKAKATVMISKGI